MYRQYRQTQRHPYRIRTNKHTLSRSGLVSRVQWGGAAPCVCVYWTELSWRQMSVGLLCLLRGTLTHGDCREAQRRTDGGNLRRFDQAPRQVAALQVLQAHGEIVALSLSFSFCLALFFFLSHTLSITCFLFNSASLSWLKKETKVSLFSLFSFLLSFQLSALACQYIKQFLPSAVAPHPGSISHPQWAVWVKVPMSPFLCHVRSRECDRLSRSAVS